MPGGGSIRCSKQTVLFRGGGAGARGRSDSNTTTAADADAGDADASAAPSPAAAAAARIATRVVSLRRENTRDHTNK